MHPSRENALKILSNLKQEREENTMQAHYDRMQAEQTIPEPKGYMVLVEQYMKEHPGTSKAEAMRQTTRKHPEAHARWIEEVNQN